MIKDALKASSFFATLAANVSRYSPSDRERLAEFRRSTFGAEAIQCRPELFRWRFEDNPAARPGEPQLWVYKRGERILGQQAGLPVTLKVGSRELRASWAVDLMVRPEHRLRGIGPVLSETHVHESEVTMGVGISGAAYRSFLRAGWVDLGNVPLFARPLVTEIRGLSGARPAGRWMGTLAHVPLRLTDSFQRLRSWLGGVSLEEIEQFDLRADDLWSSASVFYPVICRRDSQGLNWRYVRCPFRERYRLHYLLKGRQVLGYAVLRLERRQEDTVGYVVDYLSAPEWTCRLLAGCLLRLRQGGAAVAYCLHQSRLAAAALRWLGFARRESSRRFMVKTRLGEAGPLTILRDAGSWFLTAGDSDADLPGAPALDRPGTSNAQPEGTGGRRD